MASRKGRIPFCLLVVGGLGLWSSAAFAQVSGTVVEAGTMTPIEGARVTLQATDVFTETAADGTFTIPGLAGEVVVVGARQGYFHGVPDGAGFEGEITAPLADAVIQLEPVPGVVDLAYVFDPEVNCGFFCHGDQVEQWFGSRMGNTGGNTWVYDLFDGSGTPGGMGGFVYTRDSVMLGTNPDGDCAACHQPVRWIKEGGLQESHPTIFLSDDVANDFDARQGVSCDVCHKVANIDEQFINNLGPNPDQSTYTLPNPNDFQVQYGVLGDVSFIQNLVMQPSYQPQLTSLVCAQCHQYFADTDGDGVNDDIPGQTTYTEWASSEYGDPQSAMFMNCIDCHTEGFGNTQACGLINLDRDPETIHNMNFRGTTPEFLDNAVTLSMNAEIVGDAIEVEASVFNDNTGHAVPGGIIFRNMVLLIDVIRREDGQRLTQIEVQPGEPLEVLDPLAGVGDPATGHFAGLPGKLYAKFTEDAQGNQGVLFTEAVTVRDNTRILPLETDLTHYRFDLPDTGGTIDVTARLIYRRAWRDLVDAKGWIEDGQGNFLEDNQAPHFGHLMESVEVMGLDAGPFTGVVFRRGDVDADGSFNGLIDGLYGLNFGFVPGSPEPPCFDAADFDDDGTFNGLVDSLAVLNFQFAQGPPPAPPGLECGTDPTPDMLGCDTYLHCP